MEDLRKKDLPVFVRVTYEAIERLLRDLLGKTFHIAPYLSHAIVLHSIRKPSMIVMKGTHRYEILFHPLCAGYYRSGEDSWSELLEFTTTISSFPLWIRTGPHSPEERNVRVCPLYYKNKKIGKAVVIKERLSKGEGYLYILGSTVQDLFFIVECHLPRPHEAGERTVFISKVVIGVPLIPFLKIFLSLW